ncbi:RodZ domain-containing protein [Derxia lacustris]|uniref:RodZ domain-containing protein n=1 Tax=Derxia lacustris TaxID=764842 RepID=UPI0015931AE2|nr:RodZ domain-containing protein [Derxia lacustris]
MNEPSGALPADERALDVATRPGTTDPAPAEADAATAASATPTASHAGTVLARARAARQLTVEQLAQRIKVSARQVEAIEAGNWASFHTPAILRGFVRAYAKAVDIDSAPLLAELPRIEVSPGQLTGVASVGRPVGLGRRGLNGLGWWLTWGLVAALLVALAIALPKTNLAGWISAREAANGLAAQPAADPPSGATPSAAEPAPEAAPATADADAAPATGAASVPTAPVVPGQLTAPVPLQSVPVAPAASSATAPGATPSGASTGVAPQSVAGPAPAAAAPVVAAPATPPAVSPAPTVSPAPASAPPSAAPQATPVAAASAAAGASRLKLDFERETWIEIRDASGKIVSTGVSAAGASVNAEGRPPFKIIIGNVPGTRFAVDGRNVDLAPFSSGNVARFTYPPEARQ